ncbi:MAG: DUF4091 domain-containing protein, partial [Isosphaeraceae bacterium]
PPGARAADAAKGPILGEIGPNKARAAYWLESSLKRVYPGSEPGSTDLRVIAARNGNVSFQACVRNESIVPIGFHCAVVGADDLRPRVRVVGLVPLTHLTPHTAFEELEGVDQAPGLVPDPLYPETSVLLGPGESRSFWITLNIPKDATPGHRQVHAQLTPWGAKDHVDLPVRLEVSALVIQPRQNFHVIHWWRGEATWDYYKTGRFDERWWELTKGQLENMLAHGSDVIYVPIFFDRRETFKRPCQLLDVKEPNPGVYEFDWSRVKRFTDLAKQVGFKKFEWSHLWIYWGVKNPVRIYKVQGDEFNMLWPPDTGATSETYLNFLRQFLPEFHTFLTAEGLLDDSYFHLSDEPGGDDHVANYKRARQVLRELAPWMKVMDALSDIQYGKQGLTDMPIPMVNAAQAYIDAKIPHWVYFCCSPTGSWLNRFMDTPLTKIRMSGWLFYRQGALGFLHWGYNYWHLMEQEQIGDPFHDASNGSWPGIPYGDPFMIYPGKDGPIDSIRWEVFAESLQDYAILQTAGIRPDAPLLAPLKSYADFPKSEAWLRQALETVLKAPPDAASR